ncbi:MAG: FecR domain-containing protein [Nitrosomonas sp.]|nr:FecR domain-containing protein [Nitrosomonas sp.]
MPSSPNSHPATHVRREASRWFALRQSRPLVDSERRELAAWLRTHRSHRTAWQRIKKDWQSLDSLRGSLAAELQWARSPRAITHRPVLSGWVGWTAAIILLISLTPFLWQGITGSEQEWHTRVGERQEIHLADGTLLVVDAATRVTVRQNWLKRHIHLHDGEIYLDVASDLRSFHVATADIGIRDIGTRFSVRNIDQHLAVQVAEGAVEIRHAGGYTRLHAGEKITRDPEQSGRWIHDRLRSDDIAPWRQGFLMFDAQPLHSVLHELARYHAVQFDLADPVLAGIQVSGRFRLDELDSSLRILAATLHLEIERPEPARIRLTPLHARK